MMLKEKLKNLKNKNLDCHFSLWRWMEGATNQEISQFLKAENDPKPTATKEMRSLVLQLHETEFWQQPSEFGSGSRHNFRVFRKQSVQVDTMISPL